MYFDFIILFFCLFIWFLWEKWGGEAPGERGERRSGQQEKERKQSFLIARCKSYTTRTTSTRPVFDNLYCWTACNLNILTCLKENPNLLCLFNILDGGCLNKPFIDQLSLITPEISKLKLWKWRHLWMLTPTFSFCFSWTLSDGLISLTLIT